MGHGSARWQHASPAPGQAGLKGQRERAAGWGRTHWQHREYGTSPPAGKKGCKRQRWVLLSPLPSKTATLSSPDLPNIPIPRWPLGRPRGTGEPRTLPWDGQPEHRNFTSLDRSVPFPWERFSHCRRRSARPPGAPRTPGLPPSQPQPGRRAPAAVPGKSRPGSASRGFPEPAPPGGDSGRAGRGSPEGTGISGLLHSGDIADPPPGWHRTPTPSPKPEPLLRRGRTICLTHG